MDLAKLFDALKGWANLTANRQDELINQLSQIEKDNPEAAQKKLESILFTHKIEVAFRVIIFSLFFGTITLAALKYLNPGDIFTTKTETLLKKAVKNADLHEISLKIHPHHDDTTHFHVVYGDNLHLGKIININPNKFLLLNSTQSFDDDFQWLAVASDSIQIGMIKFNREELFVLPRETVNGPYQQDSTNYFTGNNRLAFKFNHERISVSDGDTVISRYKVNIGERIAATKDIIWHEHEMNIPHSPDGTRYETPVIFSHPEWSSIYIATLAMGKYDDRKPPGVYKINGRAIKLRPSS